jgi:hypothetical protein
MSNLPQDILDRIHADFPHDTELVNSMLRDLESAGVPERIRVARCVLHLAEGDLDQLGNIQEAACQDYRDVIWWAEYDHPDAPNVQVRDFNKAFVNAGS